MGMRTRFGIFRLSDIVGGPAPLTPEDWAIFTRRISSLSRRAMAEEIGVISDLTADAWIMLELELGAEQRRLEQAEWPALAQVQGD